MTFGQQLEATVSSVHMRRSPGPRTAIRIECEAISVVASRQGDAIDVVENIYRKSRTSIAHLWHQAMEPGGLPLITRMVNDLTKANDKFLARAVVEDYGTAYWRNKVAQGAADIKASLDEDRVVEAVIPAEIETFLKVVDAARHLYEEQGYSFTGFVDPKIYVLAKLVVANFEAYDKKLNG